MGTPESCSFLVFSRGFLVFSVFSRIGSSHPVVPFLAVTLKASLSQLLAKRHYRVRGKDG